MKIFELVDPNILQDHINERRVATQFHPTLPLIIYNYTHLAQFDPHWGDGTIDYCRGLIVNRDTYEIVARPFKKFHNLNTASIPETMEENLPQEVPYVTRKMDGSLGIWYPDGTSHGAIATRGSFTSPQALWATNWLKIGHPNNHLWRGEWTPWDWTPLFEIIYPENRIVVDYHGSKTLIALDGIYNHNGESVGRDLLVQAFQEYVVDRVYLSENYRLSYLAEDNTPNEEGYVATYSNGLRVKIKFKDYVSLHRIVTGMNPRSVWERLKAGQDFREFETGYPEPFTKWLMNWRDKLLCEYVTTESLAADAYLNRPIYFGDPRKNRAAFAAYVKTCVPSLKSILFMMYDGKDTKEAIWDLCEPRGDDKMFREEGE